MVIACGVLLVLSIPVALPRWQLDGNPKPPSQAQINAAENKARQQQAALGAQQGKLSSANAQLASLQVQAEVLTQRYDQTLVDEQRAATAYRVTEARLKYAQQAQDASQQRLARLAASEFESGGGFGPMTSMLGNASGPQGYLNGVGLGQVLAQNGTDTVAQAQANDVVAGAFRKQAHDLLVAEQSDLAAANHLKLAVQAAVTRQQAFVRASQAKRNSLAKQVASAQAHVAALKSARQAALAAAAAAAAAKAAAQASAAVRGGQHAGLHHGAVLGVELGRVGQPGRRRGQLGAQPAGQAVPVGRGRAGHLRLLRPDHGGLGPRGRLAAALHRVPVGRGPARAAGPVAAR